MGACGLLLTVGTRAFFALVLTDVTAHNVTGRPARDLFFSDLSNNNLLFFS
jgi:hypothetical protein